MPSFSRALVPEVRLAGPPPLLPDDASSLTIDEAIAGADVVMMLRVQRERLEEELGDGPGEYLSRYGLTADRLRKAAPNAAVMHPGPMKGNVEIAERCRRRSQRSLICFRSRPAWPREWPASSWLRVADQREAN